MRDSDFLRRQAEHCIALSRATIDLTIAGRLRAMAAEFGAKAAEWDHEEAGGYEESNCSLDGEMRRSK
jgi:hypothetical protein